MSKVKKIVSLLLALALVLALGVTAFADDTPYTITITNATSGYTYVAYQVFKGDLSSDSTTLSNVDWGDNISESAKVNDQTIYQALAEISTTVNGKAVYPFTDSSNNALTSAAAVAGVLAGYDNDSAVVNAFAEVVAKYVTGSGTTSTENTKTEGGETVFAGTYSISKLTAGYYLVKNTVVPSGDNVAYSDYILEVVNSVTVNTKNDSVPTFDKTVGDETDDATEDYAIGDTIPFKLTATMATSYTAYTTYALTFHDTLSSGLSFNSSSVVVTVTTGTTTTTVKSGYELVVSGYTEVSITEFASGTTYYTYNSTTGTYSIADSYVSGTTYYTYTRNITDGYTFDVVIKDTDSLDDASGNKITVTAGSIITVTYTATLTEDASSIENNTAKLEYSNDPNSDSTGTTTGDKTYVVTFELVVTKTDEEGNALEGAVFELYKKANITTFETDVTYYTISNGVATPVDSSATYDSSKTYYVGAGTYEGGYTYVKQTDLTEFATGVTYYTESKGTYTEVESGATFDSSATYYIRVQNTFAFDGLDVGDYVLIETETPDGYNTIDQIEFTIAATAVEDTSEANGVKITVNSPTSGSDFTVSSTTLSTTVKNQSGSTLPSTGGIGTTIFYVIGSIMVLGAVVLLITRKRMKKAE